MTADWAWLQPAATAFGAAIVGLVAFLALRQRDRADRSALSQRQHADRKQEWWRRTQWAIDKTLHADPEVRLVGYLALEQLRRGDLPDDEDRALLLRVADRELRGFDYGQAPQQEEPE